MTGVRDYDFATLERGGHSAGSPEEMHAMIFSYFDDSSDKRRERYFAAGGLIGGVEQWAEFDLRWAYATRELQKPFRSTECECQHAQFVNWSKPKCNDLMQRLVTVIRDYQLSAFASIVPIAEYREVFPGCGEFDPYYLAVAHTIINMAVIGERTKQGMKLWFENRPTSPATFNIYNSLRAVKTWALHRSCTILILEARN